MKLKPFWDIHVQDTRTCTRYIYETSSFSAELFLGHGFQALARTVNSGMLGAGHPHGWFHNVRNYVREDRIIEELLEEKGVVTAVLLKMLVSFG